MYISGTNDINMRRNKAIAHMNLMSLYQEKFQDIQEIGDQYMAMRKVYDKLDLKFRRFKDDDRAVLKEKRITEPTSMQLKKVIDKHHAIFFLYKSDKSRYGKLIEQIENDMLQRKRSFSKFAADACRILAGWKNRWQSRLKEANDAMVFIIGHKLGSLKVCFGHQCYSMPLKCFTSLGLRGAFFFHSNFFVLI